MKKGNKKDQPLISVLMPVFNAGDFLVEALDSIRNQSYRNWELICIDDCSKDNTPNILKRYKKIDKRIKVYRNPKREGIGHSLNRALRLAQGDFVARMDADDISLPLRFEKQLKLLQKRKDIVAVGGQAEIIDCNGRNIAFKKFPTDSQKLYNMIMTVVPIQHPILMTRAKIFKKYKYSTFASTAEDVDMLFYLLSKGNLGNVGSVIYKYRKSQKQNGFHSVKKTFYITCMNRFRAIEKYNYVPTFKGITITLLQFLVVTILPSYVVVRLFEALRYEPPVWKKAISIRVPYLSFPRINFSFKNW